ncbi:MAG TPA: hypothetical protein VK447_21825 [Myxococcaceae bacterium]|nr:hypothetical protein [Myxococcaceae bacterium]
MRASSEILKAIRTEVFGESQRVFGKRLPLAKETISRMELRKEGHPVTARHLRLLRGLRAPMKKAEQLEALLEELEAAVWREMQVDLGIEPGPQGAPIAGTAPTERIEADGPPAGQLPAEVPEQATPEMEEAARRLELLRLEEERRAEELRRLQESVQRAEAMLQRAEQLRLEEEERRAAHASRMAEEEVRARARRQRARWLGLVAAAVLVAFGGLAHLVRERSSRPSMEDAQAAKHHAVNPELPDGGTEPSPWEASPPEGGASSGGLDAGTALGKLLKNALPMPAGGLPRQQSAPCPEGITEEFNGHCWVRWPLTPELVRAGACDTLGLYEPSAGWCRAHNAGFRPWLEQRRTNNAVDP